VRVERKAAGGWVWGVGAKDVKHTGVENVSRGLNPPLIPSPCQLPILGI